MAILNSAKAAFANGDIDLVNDTIKAALLNSTHVTDIDAQVFFADVNANEVTGGAYVAGGEELVTKTVTNDTANDRAVFDADDASWSGVISDAAHVAIYKDTGDNATSPLIAIISFGSAQNSSTTFTVQWDADGIIHIE